MNESRKVEVFCADRVGHIVFNNPQKHNAMSLSMWQDTLAALEKFDSDPDIRVVVLSGAGGRAFISGGDISEFDQKRSNSDDAETYAKIPEAARSLVETLSKPVIAMIQGYCLGGGLALAIRADIRIASEDSIFGIPAAKLGFSYSQAGVNNLIDIIGRSAAGEMLLTAKHYTAQDALRMGLVNTVVPVQELKPEVEKLAQILAGNSPLSMRAIKYMINARTQSRHHYSEEAEQLLRRCFASQDYIEGRKAFKEKRKPVFRGE